MADATSSKPRQAMDDATSCKPRHFNNCLLWIQPYFKQLSWNLPCVAAVLLWDNGCQDAFLCMWIDPLGIVSVYKLHGWMALMNQELIRL